MTPWEPDAALIILSAGTAVRRSASQELATALARSVDWERMAATLGARRLVPQLGPRIVELAGGSATTGFATAVEQAVVQTRRQGAMLELVAARLTLALSDAGIASLLLKGAYLAEAIYGDLGRRAAADIDLLLAPQDLQEAIALARRAGYGAPNDHVGADGLPLLHHALAHERGELPPLELHWRVHWYERTFAADMLARAAPDPHHGLRATLVDELTSLLLFYARDGFLDLRLAADIGAWWDAFGSRVEPGALTAVIERYPPLERALLAALLVAERVVGLPSERLLDSEPRSEARVRLAARLANPGAHGDPSQLSADVGFIDWLLAPRAGHLEFVRRQLFPPRAVLDERARISAEGTVSPLGHAMRVLGRYGLAIARLMGSSSGAQISTGSRSRHAHSRPLLSPDSTSSSPV